MPKLTEVHRVTLLIIDHDGLGAEGVWEELENTRYANHCIGPTVLNVETVKVEWNDDHPLNHTTTMHDYAEQLFADPKEDEE
jgi:hypothetical protein